MDVDGFRFDLASILGRDQKGEMLSNPPLIEWIEEDPILRNVKIIAEAWDAGGAYQVGKFPGRWAEWNGRYRDDIRRFWRGEQGFKGLFATRLTGSSDLYNTSAPCRSINFITCHDGFTLNDLVSYNSKHNIENGENNRDGENHNFSCNWGIEGVSAPPEIERLRVRMIKNFTATLFLSLGIPMMLAGDELRRSQKGNNNSYCQDNEISWINWSLTEKNIEIYEFTRQMIEFRKNHPILRSMRFYSGEKKKGFTTEDILWMTPENKKPDWSDEDLCIAALINGAYAEELFLLPDSDFYMMFNPSGTGRKFRIPETPSGRKWKVSINTNGISGEDIFLQGKEPLLSGNEAEAAPHSLIILTA